MLLRTAVAAGSLVLALTLTACGSGGGDSDEEEKPVSAAPRVAVEGGETVVRLDADTLSRGDVAVEALQAATHQAEITAYGSVLELTELAETRGALTAAAARGAKANASLAASRAEYERTKTLHAGERAASEKALEAATAAFRADEAEVGAAEASLASLSATATQRWGGVVAGWLAQGSPRLEALLQQKERLVQLTLPPGSSPVMAPAKVWLGMAGGKTLEARLISPAPRTDPRIQGESFFFTAPSAPFLLPGRSVEGHLPVGPALTGVVVSQSAVVWWQGRAWAYLEKAGGTFVRREVATEAPVAGGWFVTTGLAAGDRVVVRGAALLLSEEGRGAVRGSEG